MVTKITIFVLIAIGFGIAGAASTMLYPMLNQSPSQNGTSEEKQQTPKITRAEVDSPLFKVVKESQVIQGLTVISSRFQFEFKEENADLYKEIGHQPTQNAVLIYPTFTETAYTPEVGFYGYFSGKCDETCLTVPIKHGLQGRSYSSSQAGYDTLTMLGYPYITDIDVDKDPTILSKYDKIILLHNEYVTKQMFDAITTHPNVVYLYPNALYAEIVVDYDDDTIKLIRGHNYPESEIHNGFDWEFENTHPYEYDTKCENWQFYEIDNGVMLNCYPEKVIFKDEKLLMAIKDF